jgi:hypothetical protein
VFIIRATVYVTTFFLVAAILSCTGELGNFSNITYSENITSIPKDNITLFSQNYSETNNIPDNIFIARIQNTTTFDDIYSKVFGTQKSEIFLDNSSKELRYTTTRSSPIVSYSLLSTVETVACCGTVEYAQHLVKPLNVDTFCNCASIPEFNYVAQPRQTGAFYVCNLTPMVKCAYDISMDISADDPHSFVELDTPGSKLMIQEKENNTILTSYFETDSGNLDSKIISLSNSKGKSNFEIIFDGENKTNTILAEDGSCIVTPFYDLDRQRLPYVDFSNGYIKLMSLVLGEGTYLDADISRIDQKAARKLITPIGDSKMVAFGLDGPYPRNVTGKGIDYMNSKGESGTLWFDVGALKNCNETDLEYLRSLVNNNSWETGVHYSKELNSLPLEEAYKTMSEENQYIYEKIGQMPKTWCCLRNRDNLTHAIYAYDKLGMYWRNGDSGVHAETDVGNLYDDTWSWWEPASHAGMTHPVFTHQLDKDPAIKYSISYSKLKTWVDNYYSNNVSIVSFYEYSQVSRNSHDAYFNNITTSGNIVTFDAHTNGVKSLINVNIPADSDTQVYDRTSNEALNYTLEKDKSLTFWVENNHTYNIILKS